MRLRVLGGKRCEGNGCDRFALAKCIKGNVLMTFLPGHTSVTYHCGNMVET